MPKMFEYFSSSAITRHLKRGPIMRQSSGPKGGLFAPCMKSRWKGFFFPRDLSVVQTIFCFQHLILQKLQQQIELWA